MIEVFLLMQIVAPDGSNMFVEKSQIILSYVLYAQNLGFTVGYNPDGLGIKGIFQSAELVDIDIQAKKIYIHIGQFQAMQNATSLRDVLIALGQGDDGWSQYSGTNMEVRNGNAIKVK